jgi:hypothetical protein
MALTQVPIELSSTPGIVDNSNTTAITIDSSENVGIGVTPYANTLSKSIDLQNGLGLFGYNNGFYLSGNGYYDGAWKYKTSGVAAKINSNSTGDTVFSSAVSGSANGAITWVDNVSITASGNVGIGTTSPSSYYADKLVVSAGYADGITIAASATTDINYLMFADTTTSIGQGWIGYYHSGDALTFASNSAERARIDASGNLLVGTTSVISAGVFNVEFLGGSKNGIDLQNTNTGNSGAFIGFFNSSGALAGAITQTGVTTTHYGSSSDQRLKENIVDAPSASNDIDAIQVRSFDWKADGSHQKYGMVAQELLEIAPEAVSQGATEEDMMGVDYSKLVPMMIKEIQSLRREVEALKENN